MWIAVTSRFNRFFQALQPTGAEVEDATNKQLSIRKSLHREYWDETTDNPFGFVVGSWGKRTAIRPPTDIDIFMQLPLDDYHRFNNYAGNGQSALLQEVKSVLESTYWQTQMRGDGQVCVVAFNSITVEVVPVFKYDDQSWVMPDTHDGGSWKTVNPASEVASLDYTDLVASSNGRKLVQMLKAWKYNCNVPIKSFILELITSEFLRNYEYRNKDFFYFDWFVRDFFRFLLSRKNTLIWAPNSATFVSLGDEWESRAISARERSVNACEYEHKDMVVHAGEEWQKIFGETIPVIV
jgi:Second Messenger Oligonucleotide or Dinucleotide Synthetase domain